VLGGGVLSGRRLDEVGDSLEGNFSDIDGLGLKIT